MICHQRPSILDHWHAVLTSADLGKQPRAVCIDDQQIVLFRDEVGEVGALPDSCAHRRMRLSEGCVVDGKLRCPYHGWTFDAQGNGESPGAPKMHARSPYFEAREEHGMIFVKTSSSQASFPSFDVDGYTALTPFTAVAPAPLELVLDNFTEIEHTAVVHGTFGYPLERMNEVTTQVIPTPTSVQVLNNGPQKPLPLPLRQLMGIGPNYEFHDDWITHFSPVHAIIDHSWRDPSSGRPARVAFRYYLFLTPVHEQETLIAMLPFAKSSWPGKYGGLHFFGPLIDRYARQEVAADCNILAKLAETDVDIAGLKLSRFDRPLGLHRKRIEAIYRGGEAELPPEPSSSNQRRIDASDAAERLRPQTSR